MIVEEAKWMKLSEALQKHLNIWLVCKHCGERQRPSLLALIDKHGPGKDLQHGLGKSNCVSCSMTGDFTVFMFDYRKTLSTPDARV
jgi:hypothetical protein